MYYTCKEAGKIIGMKEDFIHQVIAGKHLKAERNGKMYKIDAEEFERFRKTYRGGIYSGSEPKNDSYEDIQTCLNCQVPGDCKQGSPRCRLRRGVR